MGRPLRVEYAGAVYHITSRGNEKRAIFLEDEDRVELLEKLKDYHDRFGILIHSYVLMDNHYHLILETPRGNLLRVMHGLNGGYTGYFNRKYGRVGHLFQGRYRGILVEKETYLIPLSRYVHLNPVRAGVVENPEEYPWSSYRGFIGRGKKEEWVEYSGILSEFGRDQTRARRGYRKYVEEGLSQEAQSPLGGLRGGLVLGGEAFVEKIKGMLGGKRISREVPERRRLIKVPSPEEVIRAVAKAFGVKGGEIQSKRSRWNTARKAAMYLCQRYCGVGNAEVGKIFGGIHYSGVTKASERLREEMTSDKKLVNLMNEVISQFKT